MTAGRAGGARPARALVPAVIALGSVFARAGLTQEALQRLTGISSPDDIGLLNHAPALERLRGQRAAAAVLARLFYLEAEESHRSIAMVLSRAEVARFVTAGLLARTRGGVRARLRVDIVQQRYVLADRRFEPPDARALGLPPGDMVYPPGGDSAILAEVVEGLEGERVLDVCTGSGVQGVVAAARAGHVWMTDISARAAAVAGANTVLNRLNNVTTLVGDLFRPLGSERFDLIIANPPFVPGPRRGPAYHSGGARGDRVLRRILAGLGARLLPNGRAVLISHVALRAGETPTTALASGLRGFPGRVLILSLESGTPIDLAAAQAVFALRRGLTAYAREVRTWTAYLHRHGIERIVALLIVAERRGRRRIDLVDGARRVLPIPLSRSPREHVIDWLS